ncbi:DUF1187 family protein [Salmonella enterica subsp. enterica]|nr:DUF1187 family protein [Salmonella enterica subsp. enterica]
MYKYRITAIVKKPGNSPTNWVRFSDKKMNKAECEKMLAGRTEAGKSREEKSRWKSLNVLRNKDRLLNN